MMKISHFKCSKNIMYNVYILMHSSAHIHRKHIYLPTLGNFFCYWPFHFFINFPHMLQWELRRESKMVTVPHFNLWKTYILKGSFLKPVSMEITADSVTVFAIVRKELLLWGSDEFSEVHLKTMPDGCRGVHSNDT